MQPSRPRVALTFDDGPNPGATDAILDLLARFGIRATFCVVGESILAHQGAALLRRTVAEGHMLANHSSDFRDLGSATADEIRARLLSTNRIIGEALGVERAPVRWFRAPNGSWGEGDLVADVGRELGMRPLRLGNVIHDWRDDWQDPERLTRNLRAAVQPSAIVLAHDGGGRRDGTVEAFRRVLPSLVGSWDFVLPDELSPAGQ